MKKFLVKSLLRLLSRLPLKTLYGVGRSVARLLEKRIRYREADVLINLSRCFPEKKYGEIKDIKHKFYQHLGEVLAETVWFGGCRNPERLRKQHLVEIENPEEINRLYEVSPSVMVLMSHAGNWELIGGTGSYDYSGNPTHIAEDNYFVVYLRQSSKMWDDIMRENRTAPLLDRKGYQGYIEARNVVRRVYELKDRKIFYNFITDQHPYFDAPDFLKVEFMHQECTTMKGAAELARKFGMSVCFLSMRQEERGRYKVNYRTICDDASQLTAETIMKQYYKLLEADIEAQPWNYLWTHRRWKY